MTLVEKVSRLKTQREPSASQPRGEKAARTRASIVKAAEELIGSRGYNATSCEEIAEHAGVSKGVLFYHFKNKAAIGMAILQEGLQQLVADLEGIAQEAESGAEALRQMVTVFVNLTEERKDFIRFFITEVWREREEWQSVIWVEEGRIHQVIAEQLRRGQEEGIIRTTIEPDFVSTAFIGMCLSLSLDRMVHHPIMSREEFLDQLIDFGRRGLVVPGLAD